MMQCSREDFSSRFDRERQETLSDLKLMQANHERGVAETLQNAQDVLSERFDSQRRDTSSAFEVMESKLNIIKQSQEKLELTLTNSRGDIDVTRKTSEHLAVALSEAR